jgi:hypothetical protein
LNLVMVSSTYNVQQQCRGRAAGLPRTGGREYNLIGSVSVDLRAEYDVDGRVEPRAGGDVCFVVDGIMGTLKNGNVKEFTAKLLEAIRERSLFNFERQLSNPWTRLLNTLTKL